MDFDVSLDRITGIGCSSATTGLVLDNANSVGINEQPSVWSDLIFSNPLKLNF